PLRAATDRGDDTRALPEQARRLQGARRRRDDRRDSAQRERQDRSECTDGVLGAAEQKTIVETARCRASPLSHHRAAGYLFQKKLRSRFPGTSKISVSFGKVFQQ